MPLVKASNTITNFNGVASFMPIVGALVADSFAGRYWTIILALLIYELGMIIITISAVLPQFRPKSTAKKYLRQAWNDHHYDTQVTIITLIQAGTMDRHLSNSFEIPPASMGVFAVLATVVSLALYDRLFIPFAYRFTKNHAGITCLQRIGVGYVINIFGTLIASFVEIKRKQVARDHNLLDKPTETIPISVFWLIPQYSLHGVAEAFFQVGKLEFLYDQSPESMKSTALALNWSAIALGQYAGTLMVTMVHKYTAEGNGANWLPDRNLSRGRLEYYYMLVSGIQVLNLVYYCVCAWFYTYKHLEEASESNQDGDVELVVDKIVVDVRNGTC